MIGFGFFASFFSSVNCRFRRAGYIIRNKHTPMGMDIPANCRLLMARLNSGITCERASPVSMHKKTHSARYFSKKPRWISVFSPKGYSPKRGLFVVSFLSCNPCWTAVCLAAFVFWDSVWASEFFVHGSGHFLGS